MTVHKQNPVDENDSYYTEKIHNLQSTISDLQNENIILNEKIDELMSNKTFQGGKYNDNIREIYAALLSMNIDVKNVEKVIKIVLEKMANLQVNRLPKKTFAVVMLVEAKVLAQLQAPERPCYQVQITRYTPMGLREKVGHLEVFKYVQNKVNIVWG